MTLAGEFLVAAIVGLVVALVVQAAFSSTAALIAFLLIAAAPLIVRALR